MSESNRALLEEFYASFQTARAALISRLDALRTAGIPAPRDLNETAQAVAKLRKDLIDATSFLPSYDQRKYDQDVKAMEQSLEELRSASTPKSKFAFKRRADKSSMTLSPTPSESSSTSSSVQTPSVNSLPSTGPSSDHLLLSGYKRTYLSLSHLPSLRSSSASDLTISDLDHCILNLLPTSAETDVGAATLTALHARNLTDSVLILPILKGSVLLHDLKRCTIVLGCHQFRMHTSSSIDVYLSIPSHPVIENCSDIRFAGYPSQFPGCSGVTSNVSTVASKHLNVHDFSHIRATPSPNWSQQSENTTVLDSNWPTSHVVEEAEMDAVLQRLLPTC